MAQPSGHGLLIIERILRDRDGIWQQVVEERGLKELITQMLASSAVSLACYGAVLGASNSFAQALSSAVKLPLLFLVTLAICLPTLYLFNLVFGARLSVVQAVTLIMVSITVTSVLTLAFAPISLFFLITAHSYSFFKLLNVSILILTAVVGLRFLTLGMRALNEHHLEVDAAAAELSDGGAPNGAPTPELVAAMVGAPDAGGSVGAGSSAAGSSLPIAPAVLIPAQRPMVLSRPAAAALQHRPASMSLLNIWIVLFGFVGTQLAWTLRPFFGDPGQGFSLFRNISGTFYGDIFATIGRLLGG